MAQSDNFDDGNADDWNELRPLSPQVMGMFSFPDDLAGGKAYRMGSDPSGNGDSPGRIGSYRGDVSYEDFYMSVDLIDWDQSQDQNMGVLARMRQPGFGTLDGYGVTYNPHPSDQKMYLSVITDEAPTNVEIDVFLDPGTPVRMVFQGSGPNLKAELYRLDDLATPVATLELRDDTYPSGFCGVFNSADGGDPATDCTFDNYFAAPEEPLEFRITTVTIEDGMMNFEFLSKPGVIYSFWESPDMTAWIELVDDIEATGATTRYMTPLPAEERMFYQFRRPAPD
jgi:hypothetical protein